MAIIGILAAFATVQYFKLTERSVTTEALEWMHSVSGAQDRHRARYGVFHIGAITNNTFDVGLTHAVFSPLNRFTVGPVVAVGSSWGISVFRSPPCPFVYGCYTLTYNGLSRKFTCSNSACTQDLIQQ